QDLSFAKILAFLQRAIDCKEVYHTHTFPPPPTPPPPPPPPLPFHKKAINKLKRMARTFLQG
uniref:hypothetical protein n=1 Tax=Helicobacter suis TaxID=104628 RepID=UPI001968413D